LFEFWFHPITSIPSKAFEFSKPNIFADEFLNESHFEFLLCYA